MRKIFILLIGCTLLLSCSKDEKTQEEKERDIFNILIGKWQFSRVAKDAEFKEIIEIEMEDCDKYNYVEFSLDSCCISRFGCDRKDMSGKFEITFYNEEALLCLSEGAGIALAASQIAYGGYLPLLSINKNTFILAINYYTMNYIEFKRID